jgi:hypothetical protein
VCFEGYLTGNFCSGGNVVATYQYADCSTEDIVQEFCTCGCTGDQCDPTYSTGCGSFYCIGDDVYADCTNDICVAPSSTLQEVCDYGCSSGACNPPPPPSPSPAPLGDCYEGSSSGTCTVYYNDAAGNPESVVLTTSPVTVCVSATNPSIDVSDCDNQFLFYSFDPVSYGSCYVDGDC